jgi:quinol monooxygenase YgiN
MRILRQVMIALALTLPAMSAARAQGTSDPTLYIHVYFEAVPSAARQVAALLKDVADASRKEAGVLRFDVLQRTASASQFAIAATWKDQQAVDAHLAAAYTKQFREKAEPLLIAPLDDRLCIPFTAGANPGLTGAPAPSAGALYVMTHVDIAGPNPQNMNAFMPVLKAFGEASRSAPGALRYDVLQQKNRNNHFQVYEIWRDEKSADDHDLTAQAKDYRAKFHPVSGALYDRRWYKAL